MSKPLERIVELTPAYDRRDEGYGIHGVELRMILRGPKGAVQFVVYTNWHLPHIQRETDRRILNQPFDKIDLSVSYHPLPAGVSYHSPKPLYEGQTPMNGECPHVEGGVCYYDGSGLRAEKWFNEILLPKGSDGIWEALEQEYNELFEKEIEHV